MSSHPLSHVTDRGDEATVYADKAYRWGKKGTTFPTPQLADLWRAVRQAYIDGGKAKKLTEGEGETSMDDILDAFQAALAIEDDVKADQALKAVYMALKDKVKGKLGQAADYAKDKLTKYADNLEENV